MSERDWTSVRQCMRTDVTMVNGRISVLEALRIMMKPISVTCLEAIPAGFANLMAVNMAAAMPKATSSP